MKIRKSFLLEAENDATTSVEANSQEKSENPEIVSFETNLSPNEQKSVDRAKEYFKADNRILNLIDESIALKGPFFVTYLNSLGEKGITVQNDGGDSRRIADIIINYIYPDMIKESIDFGADTNKSIWGWMLEKDLFAQRTDEQFVYLHNILMSFSDKDLRKKFFGNLNIDYRRLMNGDKFKEINLYGRKADDVNNPNTIWNTVAFLQKKAGVVTKQSSKYDDEEFRDKQLGKLKGKHKLSDDIIKDIKKIIRGYSI